MSEKVSLSRFPKVSDFWHYAVSHHTVTAVTL
jgi:hypothetical protein